MDDATVSAIPEITAGHLEASLIHEAAIGKIAGEQLIKLMTCLLYTSCFQLLFLDKQNHQPAGSAG